MQPCSSCKQQAEWRYKEGWGALACADWFAGTCEGEPLEIAPPSVGDVRPLSLEIEEDERLRALGSNAPQGTMAVGAFGMKMRTPALLQVLGIASP
jgi:hypothetical protein